jgi:hypothetical protein
MAVEVAVQATQPLEALVVLAVPLVVEAGQVVGVHPLVVQEQREAVGKSEFGQFDANLLEFVDGKIRSH